MLEEPAYLKQDKNHFAMDFFFFLKKTDGHTQHLIWMSRVLETWLPSILLQMLVWRFSQGSAAACIPLTEERSSSLWRKAIHTQLSVQLCKGCTWNGEGGGRHPPSQPDQGSTLAINGVTDVAARLPSHHHFAVGNCKMTASTYHNIPFIYHVIN